MASLKLGVSGARGIVGEGLTPEAVARLGAFFAGGRAGGTLLAGADTRPTGPMVRRALFAGLTAAGCDILDCGVCPTPSILLAVASSNAEGGAVVTASHNPIEWNAVKFVGREGFFLGEAEGKEIARRFRDEEPPYVPHDRVGHVAPGPDVEAAHIEAILGLDRIDREAVRRRRWKVVVDGAGGAGSRLVRTLLERLGCVVEAIHCDMGGGFPRPPEPRPENLGDLCRRVAESGAAVGFALDPDGDRLSLVAAGGRPLAEERTVALVVEHVLSRERGPVVVNLSTSRAVEDLAGRYGVPFHRTPVGEAHVAEKMRAVGAVVGGEGNGGVMFPALHPMRCAATGIALLLQAMTDRNAGLDELDRSVPSYVLLKEALPAEKPAGEALVAALEKRFGPASVDRRDGVRLAWDRGWIHVRPSNTEPVVRLFAEASEREGAEELRAAAAEELRDHAARLAREEG